MSVRKALVLSAAVALALLGTAPTALAQGFGHHHGHAHHQQRHDWSSDESDDSGDDSPDTGQPDTVPLATDNATDEAGVTRGTVLSGAERRVAFRITGFGKKDNTPPGSTTISQPVIHSQAGGTGTFSDPLTAASPGSSGATESPKGTKFYVPSISRYVIVEDSGASKFSQPHLDIWSGTTDNVEDCEGKITGTVQVIRNPKAGYPVKAGPIATGSGCNI